MARQLRFEYPGAVYHIMARGDGGKWGKRGRLSLPYFWRYYPGPSSEPAGLPP